MTNPTPAARDNFIDGELTDVRRLLDALQKIVEVYVDESLEAREPLLALQHHSQQGRRDG